MKKSNSKTVFIIIGVILLIVIITQVFGNDESGNGSTDDPETTRSAESANSETKSTDSNIMDTTGAIGDYVINIKSMRLVENYDGSPSVIVTYEFTNNNDEVKSFSLAVTDKVYQDGIECESTISAFDDDTYDSANQLKDIKPGATLEVEVIYKLNNETSDIEVEVTELISFSKNPKMVTRTFSLNG